MYDIFVYLFENCHKTDLAQNNELIARKLTAAGLRLQPHLGGKSILQRKKTFDQTKHDKLFFELKNAILGSGETAL